MKKLRMYATVITCLLLILFSVFCVKQILHLYGQYSYENKLNTLQIPTISEPSYVCIEIGYIGKPPTDISISNSHMNDYICDISHVETEKRINIAFDTDVPDNYVLSLLPQDNYELTYKIDIKPSLSHIATNIVRYFENDEPHMKIYAYYGYTDSDLGVNLILEAPGFSKTVTLQIPNGEETVINIADYVDTTRLDSVKININTPIIEENYTERELIDLRNALYRINNDSNYIYVRYDYRLNRWEGGEELSTPTDATPTTATPTDATN